MQMNCEWKKETSGPVVSGDDVILISSQSALVG
jgi:hypothetical protein